MSQRIMGDMMRGFEFKEDEDWEGSEDESEEEDDDEDWEEPEEDYEEQNIEVFEE